MNDPRTPRLLAIPVEAKAAFLDLAYDLEPDAPARHDGLANQRQITNRMEDVMARWRDLERRHGVNLTPDQAVDTYGTDRETQRAIATAKLGNLSPDIEAEVESQVAMHAAMAGVPAFTGAAR